MDDLSQDVYVFSSLVIQHAWRTFTACRLEKKLTHARCSAIQAHKCMVMKRVSHGVANLLDVIPTSHVRYSVGMSESDMKLFVDNKLDVEKVGKKTHTYRLCKSVRVASCTGESLPMLTFRLSLPTDVFRIQCDYSIVAYVRPGKGSSLSDRHKECIDYWLHKYSSRISTYDVDTFDVEVDGVFVGGVCLRKFMTTWKGESFPALCIDSFVTMEKGKGYGLILMQLCKRLVGKGGILFGQFVKNNPFWEFRMHMNNVARGLVLQDTMLHPFIEVYPECQSRCLVL